MEQTILKNRERIISCCDCPRLVSFRTGIAERKRKSFMDWDYWGKPVPGYGDPGSRLMILGLAPAAHGGDAARPAARAHVPRGARSQGREVARGGAAREQPAVRRGAALPVAAAVAPRSASVPHADAPPPLSCQTRPLPPPPLPRMHL